AAKATTISRSRWCGACCPACWLKPPAGSEDPVMDMNQPAPRNALDDNRHGHMGRAMDRVDGPRKVTGTAPYAYEVREGARPAYGYIVEAGIARGSVRGIDTAAAERAPGVL